MRHFGIIVLLGLGGCAGSVFDPAPYRPDSGVAVAPPPVPGAEPASLVQFEDLDHAASKLKSLASGYAGARDRIMRQQLFLDVPAIGLGVATVASGLFHGAKDATLALGLGSTTVGGARLYFSPQVKVVAYNNAASALDCASSVAALMAAESHADRAHAVDVEAQMRTSLALADDRITSGGISKSDSATLLAARDAAQKSLVDLDTAISTIDTASGHLQTFAVTVIRGATTKVVTGTQNVDAVLTLVRGGAGSAPVAKPPSSGSAPGVVFALGRSAGLSPAEIASRLQELSAEAAPISKRITDVWGGLTSCSNTS